jgi:hypothetical protein
MPVNKCAILCCLCLTAWFDTDDLNDGNPKQPNGIHYHNVKELSWRFTHNTVELLKRGPRTGKTESKK